ncbi:MAG: zinc ribbon domain-containing protein [Oscillospiraceae bacterium]|nr:zinc ribbon domain-containing protein [Oscillospiraceae bacterium]
MKEMKTCPGCKSVLADDAAFCPECGAPYREALPPFTSPQQQRGQQQQQRQQVAYCPGCGAEIGAETPYCPHCGSPVSAPGQWGSFIFDDDDDGNGKKKGRRLKIRPLFIGVAAAVAVVGIAILAFLLLRGGPSGSSYLVYAKDKQLQYSQLSESGSFQLTARLFDSDTPHAIEFMNMYPYVLVSNDGRYVFYPDRSDNNTYTYYWRETGAKDGDATKVDSDIVGIPSLSQDGGKLFYVRDEDMSLYVYDRASGEKNKLDGDIVNVMVNDAGDYLLYTREVDGEVSIYETIVKGIIGEKEKIDSNVAICQVFVNEKKVFYTKEESLYCKEYGKGKEKLASGVTRVLTFTSETGADDPYLYYLKSNMTTSRLSSFINDDLANSDQNLVEPSYPTYPAMPIMPIESDYPATETWIPFDWGNLLDSYDPSEWENAKHVLVAGGQVSAIWNEAEEEYGNWEYTSEAFNEASAMYLYEMTVWEAECGSLEETYEIEWAHYQDKAKRDELRLALGNPENAVSVENVSLYYWQGGEERLISSHVGSWIDSSTTVPVILYRKYETDQATPINLSVLLAAAGPHFSVSDVVDEIRWQATYERAVSPEVFVALGEKEASLGGENAERWRLAPDGTIYFLDSYDYDNEYGILTSVATQGQSGSLSAPLIIDEEVASYTFGHGTSRVYYGKGIKDNHGDLYRDGVHIASDVHLSPLYNFMGTDTILYYKNFREDASRGSLAIFRDGLETVISHDVSYFMPTDEQNVAFLVDYNRERERGDLLLYNGGARPVTLDTDVTAMLWNPDMVWGGNWGDYWGDY